MVTGECRLCKQVRPLCKSHLLPAAIYRVLRAPGHKDPNPILIDNVHHGTTSRQLRAPLLCVECEARFRAQGEDWVLANYYRGNDTFKLRESLRNTKPLYSDQDFTLYSGANIPDIDIEALVYFASSVFWRAAVRT